MRYGMWIHREQGAVVDQFGGFVEAANEEEALAAARQQYPTALAVAVQPRPINPAAEAFWGGVADSLSRQQANEEILEAGRAAADTI